MKVAQPSLKPSPFLNLHMMNSGVHEFDRERATSLVKNMVLPSKKSEIWKNPYFAD